MTNVHDDIRHAMCDNVRPDHLSRGVVEGSFNVHKGSDRTLVPGHISESDWPYKASPTALRWALQPFVKEPDICHPGRETCMG